MSLGPGRDFPAKARMVGALRSARLLPLIERAYGKVRVRRFKRKNDAYSKRHHHAPLPPPDLVQRTHGSPDLAHFDRWGGSNAEDLIRVLTEAALAPSSRLAEWGCGLGRVARHLEGRFDYTGFDVDPSSVAWCQENLSGDYRLNQPNPPLPAADSAFDGVLALSVFTHLSLDAHRLWRDEILRVLKPGGVFAFTVHGEAEAGGLLNHERQLFEQGQLVVRGRVAEGSRTYLSYAPDHFVRSVLLPGFEPLRGPEPACGQTLYLARKPA